MFSPFSPAFKTLGDTFIGAIRSNGPGLITRSLTFLRSDRNASHTIGKPILPKIHDILPAVIESILRDKRARLFDTFVRKYRCRQKTRRSSGREKGRPRLFVAIYGLISMNLKLHATMSPAAHGVRRHTLHANVCIESQQSVGGAFKVPFSGAFNAFSTEARLLKY